jgi:hypothetical protein
VVNGLVRGKRTGTVNGLVRVKPYVVKGCMWVNNKSYAK